MGISTYWYISLLRTFYDQRPTIRPTAAKNICIGERLLSRSDARLRTVRSTVLIHIIIISLPPRIWYSHHDNSTTRSNITANTTKCRHLSLLVPSFLPPPSASPRKCPSNYVSISFAAHAEARIECRTTNAACGGGSDCKTYATTPNDTEAGAISEIGTLGELNRETVVGDNFLRIHEATMLAHAGLERSDITREKCFFHSLFGAPRARFLYL